MGDRKKGEPRRQSDRWKHWRVNGIRVSVDTYTGLLVSEGDGTDEERNDATRWVCDTLEDAGHKVDGLVIHDKLFRRRD